MELATVITASVILHLLALLVSIRMKRKEDITITPTHLTPEDFARADEIKLVCDWYHEPITIGGNPRGSHTSHGMCRQCRAKFDNGEPLPKKETSVNQSLENLCHTLQS